MSYIYVGPVTRTPTLHGGGGNPCHYQVHVDANAHDPVKVAGDERTLLEGGGTVVWPGGGVSIYGLGVWVVGPKYGALATVSIEAELRARIISQDVLGMLQSTGGWKSISVPSSKVPPNVWLNVSSGITGTFAIHIRARGGSILLATHHNNNLPPTEQPEGVGGYYELRDGESHLWPGNPLLWVWTYEPDVWLDFVKFVRARTFGV